MDTPRGSSSRPIETPPPRGGLWRRHPALMVAATYGILGLIYIAVSDEVVNWITRNPETLTTIQTWKGWGWIVLTTFLIFALVDFSVRAARAADRERHASDARYRRMIETTNEGVVVADASGDCQYVNQTMARMLGAKPDELVGKRCGTCASEECRPLVEQALMDGRGTDADRFDCEFIHTDGSSVWAIVSNSPIIDEATGARTGTLFMVADITARKDAERAIERNLETQRLLLNELDHRVRNNLSSLSSLIDLSRSATGDVNEFAAIMSGRVQAMAKAHGLTGRAGNDGLDLSRVIAEMIPNNVRSRVSIDGPRIPVQSPQMVSLAMLLHELASRSARSGAIAASDGRAEIAWKTESGHEGDARIVLTWREWPTNDESAADSHADALIAGLVQRDLHGRMATTRVNDATVYTMHLTLAPMLQNSNSH